AAQQIFGIAKQDAIGKSWAEIINWLADDLEVAKSILVQQIEGKLDFTQLELSFIHPVKGLRTISVSTHPVRDESGNLISIDGITEDITQRTFIQEQIRLAATVFSNSQEGILITDMDNRIVDVNPACLELTGYTRDEVIGNTPGMFGSGTQSAEFYAEMWKTLTTTGHWQGEIWNRKKSGEIYSERLSIDAVYDENKKLQHYVAVFYDITYLKEHEAELEHIAYNDALTGLPNRLLLRDRMQQAISKTNRNEKLLAVCYLDLDGFKPVNDTYGHKAGDKVLVEVAKRLQNTVRADDTVARIGGDEFILLMLDIDSIGELKQVLERVLKAVCKPYSILTDSVSTISASIGLTLYPQDNVESDMLIRHADQAMYIAKQRGKNRYSFFDSNEEQRVSAEHAMQHDIEVGLMDGQLCLYYQPKINMHTNSVVGVEALIRWLHPEKGLLSPAAFLPSIQHTQHIVDVGNWVLRQALSQMRLWQAQGINLKVSVNIDAMQLLQDDFVPSLIKLLAEYKDIPASSLELEILETSALHDIDQVSHIMQECSKLGVQFSLDDFGTGYSSLTYLKRLPAQVLKIDKSFIFNLLENSDDMTIVEAILGLSHAFHRTPLAEGVETEQIGTMLLNLGCKLAQGYAIARPMPAEKLPEWIANYTIPTVWREAKDTIHSDADYSMLLISLKHHRLISQVIYAIEQRAPSLIPEHFFDHHACEFGQWLYGEGNQHYGQLAVFSHIIAKHKVIHKLIIKSTELLGKNDDKALEYIAMELNKIRNEILDSLTKLRNIKT
ncbi:MAG: EAL domain-containing protein, partial [Pseudomonadota bacterium]